MGVAESTLLSESMDDNNHHHHHHRSSSEIIVSDGDDYSIEYNEYENDGVIITPRKELRSHPRPRPSPSSVSSLGSHESPTKHARAAAYTAAIATYTSVLRGAIIGAPKSGKTSLFRRLQGKSYQNSSVGDDENDDDDNDSCTASVRGALEKADSATIRWRPPLQQLDHKKLQRHHPMVNIEILDINLSSQSGDGGEESSKCSSVPAGLLHFFIWVIDPRRPLLSQKYVLDSFLANIKDGLNLPLFILLNFRDIVPGSAFKDELKEMLTNNEERTQYIASQGSMKNCFGLLDLHAFFNIPYLQLEKKQLELKLSGINNAISERWSALQRKQSISYDEFLNILRNDKVAGKVSPKTKKMDTAVTQSSTASRTIEHSHKEYSLERKHTIQSDSAQVSTKITRNIEISDTSESLNQSNPDVNFRSKITTELPSASSIETFHQPNMQDTRCNFNLDERRPPISEEEELEYFLASSSDEEGDSTEGFKSEVQINDIKSVISEEKDIPNSLAYKENANTDDNDILPANFSRDDSVNRSAYLESSSSNSEELNKVMKQTTDITTPTDSYDNNVEGCSTLCVDKSAILNADIGASKKDKSNDDESCVDEVNDSDKTSTRLVPMENGITSETRNISYRNETESKALDDITFAESKIQAESFNHEKKCITSKSSMKIMDDQQILKDKNINNNVGKKKVIDDHCGENEIPVDDNKRANFKVNAWNSHGDDVVVPNNSCDIDTIILLLNEIDDDSNVDKKSRIEKDSTGNTPEIHQRGNNLNNGIEEDLNKEHIEDSSKSCEGPPKLDIDHERCEKKEESPTQNQFEEFCESSESSRHYSSDSVKVYLPKSEEPIGFPTTDAEILHDEDHDVEFPTNQLNIYTKQTSCGSFDNITAGGFTEKPCPSELAALNEKATEPLNDLKNIPGTKFESPKTRTVEVPGLKSSHVEGSDTSEKTDSKELCETNPDIKKSFDKSNNRYKIEPDDKHLYSETTEDEVRVEVYHKSKVVMLVEEEDDIQADQQEPSKSDSGVSREAMIAIIQAQQALEHEMNTRKREIKKPKSDKKKSKKEKRVKKNKTK